MKKIVLPENMTKTILMLGKKEGMIKTFEFGEEIDSVMNEEINSLRRNRKKEQIVYQLLLLYDEMVLTDFTFEGYDISKLTNEYNITYLNMREQESIFRPDHSSPYIEPDFAQYIKPAVIQNIKKGLSQLYKVKDPDVSDLKFASILYDIVYSSMEEADILVEKYGHLLETNALRYDLKCYINNREVRRGELYEMMVSFMVLEVEKVLRDFELVRNEDTVILDPPYAIDKLGVSSKSISDLSDIYGTLKIECNKMIPDLPAFNSIQEVFNYKEKNKKQIKRFRQEIDNLEKVLASDGREKMIIQATKDVEKSSKELFKLEKTKVDTWCTFISLPATILEYYKNLPPVVSIPLSVIGISSFFHKKYVEDKHGWIRVIR